MDYYIIQREEKDIGRDLSNELVEILTAKAGIHKIDATMLIKNFQGMLKISGEDAAGNVSESFQKAGLDNFIIKEEYLVPLPERQRLLPGTQRSNITPGLIAAGFICKESQQTIRRWNPLNVKMAFAAPLIIDSGIRESKKTKKQITYLIDIITLDMHWEISKPVFPQKEIKELEKLDLLNTYLSSDIRKMFQGQKDIKTFPERKYYNDYLTWLMQLVYAKPS